MSQSICRRRIMPHIRRDWPQSARIPAVSVYTYIKPPIFNDSVYSAEPAAQPARPDNTGKYRFAEGAGADNFGGYAHRQ